MLPPLPRCSRRAQTSLKLTRPYQPSPKWVSGRPAHRPFRGLLSVHSRCGLHTRTVTYVTVIRGLQTFRHLHACPGCFRLELLAGWDFHPLESAAFARRTPDPAVQAVWHDPQLWTSVHTDWLSSKVREHLRIRCDKAMRHTRSVRRESSRCRSCSPMRARRLTMAAELLRYGVSIRSKDPSRYAAWNGIENV